MFKEWEDYVLAAAAIVCLVAVGKEVKKSYDEMVETKAANPAKWMARCNEAYKDVSDKLSAVGASPKARCEAYAYAREMLEKEIMFYEQHKVCRDLAIAYNNKTAKGFIDIWK